MNLQTSFIHLLIIMEEGWPVLDFDKFPDKAITGLTLSEINKIMQEDSLPHMDDSLPNEIMEMLNEAELNMGGREGAFVNDIFGNENDENCLPGTVVDMLDETERSMKPKSTSVQEKLHSTRFFTFLAEKNIHCDLKTVSTENLNEYLRFFYHELKTKGGEYYSPASLKCIRAALHRHFTQDVGCKFNIIDGEDFASANRMLKTMAGLWLAHGGEKKQFVNIEESDLKKIFSSFKRSNGEELQNEVLFSLLYFLGARGREELRRIKRSDLCFSVDSNGVKYAFIKSEKDQISEPNNLRKNVKASLKSADYESVRSNRIYDTKAIECIELYLRKLQDDAPDSDDLFHRPVNGRKNGPRYYSDKQVRGQNYLGNFMKTISKALHLSRLYTNHCIRCTTVTRAKENGLNNSDVCLITGHKDQRSIDRYDRPTDSRKRQLSSALTIEKATTSMELQEKLTISTSVEKKMKITADGNSNTITFEFL